MKVFASGVNVGDARKYALSEAAELTALLSRPRFQCDVASSRPWEATIRNLRRVQS